MLIILILLLMLALGGGAWGHSRWGYAGWSPAGLLVLVAEGFVLGVIAVERVFADPAELAFGRT